MILLQELVPVVEGADAVDTIVQNIPTFLNTFLIFWNLRQSRKNQQRLRTVERKVDSTNLTAQERTEG